MKTRGDKVTATNKDGLHRGSLYISKELYLRVMRILKARELAKLEQGQPQNEGMPSGIVGLTRNLLEEWVKKEEAKQQKKGGK